MIRSQNMVATNLRPKYNKDYSNHAVMTVKQNPLQLYRKGYIYTKGQGTSTQRTQELMNQMMDTPGRVIHNNCRGIPSEQQIVLTSTCANDGSINKALKLLRNKPTMSKQYAQNYYQYLQKRCKTYQQRIFNFAMDTNNPVDKPGSPYALTNYYMANCVYNGQPITPKSCQLVVYKPNNYQYAVQGAVSSGLRTDTLASQTIETSAYLNQFCVKS